MLSASKEDLLMKDHNLSKLTTVLDNPTRQMLEHLSRELGWNKSQVVRYAILHLYTGTVSEADTGASEKIDM